MQTYRTLDDLTPLMDTGPEPWREMFGRLGDVLNEAIKIPTSPHVKPSFLDD